MNNQGIIMIIEYDEDGRTMLSEAFKNSGYSNTLYFFNKAYSLSAQGFFKKRETIKELEKNIPVIMEYWKRCAAPNNFYKIAS